MLGSPANRVLSLSGRRILDRLEIEFHHHGGKPEQNGNLPCTYEHFEEYGIERHAIAPAIREVVALGFVEITRRGCAGNAGFRLPTLYRLTYRHTGSDKRLTDEWRNIETIEEAKAIAKAAREGRPVRRPKNKSSVRVSHTVASAGRPTSREDFPVRQTPPPSSVRETPPPIYSGQGRVSSAVRTKTVVEWKPEHSDAK